MMYNYIQFITSCKFRVIILASKINSKKNYILLICHTCLSSVKLLLHINVCLTKYNVLPMYVCGQEIYMCIVVNNCD